MPVQPAQTIAKLPQGRKNAVPGAKKAPVLSKGREPESLAIPPNVHRQLTLPASSGTACHSLYPSTITDAGTVTAYYPLWNSV